MVQVRYYNTQKRIYRYVDVNSQYTEDTKGLQLFDQDAIINCFLNLMNTDTDELWFEPTYGGNLQKMIFDNAIASRELRLFNKSVIACQVWLPMVTIDTSKCSLTVDAIRGIANLIYTFSINNASPITLGLTVYANS